MIKAGIPAEILIHQSFHGLSATQNWQAANGTRMQNANVKPASTPEARRNDFVPEWSSRGKGVDMCYGRTSSLRCAIIPNLDTPH